MHKLLHLEEPVEFLFNAHSASANYMASTKSTKAFRCDRDSAEV